MPLNLHKGRALTSLSLTPLIDVVFLLLIFFLVATKFAEEDRQLDVQLPTANEARPLTQQPQQLHVGVTEDGHFFVEGRRLTFQELDETMARAVENNPVSQAVVIRADERVDLRHVVQVMDLCNRHAISDYDLTVKE